MQEEEERKKTIETVIMEDLEYIKKRLWWIYEAREGGGQKAQARVRFCCGQQRQKLLVQTTSLSETAWLASR